MTPPNSGDIEGSMFATLAGGYAISPSNWRGLGGLGRQIKGGIK